MGRLFRTGPIPEILYLDIYVVFNFNSLKDNDKFQISNQGQAIAYFIIFIDSEENSFHIPHKS